MSALVCPASVTSSAARSTSIVRRRADGYRGNDIRIGSIKTERRCRGRAVLSRAHARDVDDAYAHANVYEPNSRRSILGGIGATVGAWSLPTRAEDIDEVGTAPKSVGDLIALPQVGAVLITGANSGVGLSAAKMLVAEGKTVVLACRTEQKGQDAKRQLLAKMPGAADRILVLPKVGLEMTDLRLTSDYCKAFLDSVIPLDVLLLNAGIMAVPLGRTKQGHEMHFGVNHLAHFLVQDSLAGAMRDRAKATGTPGRIAATSSIANMLPGALDINDLDWQKREPKYEKWQAYAASKAENVLTTDELTRRECKRNDKKQLLVANSFHPGIVTTNLVRYILPELTAENRDPEAERMTPQGQAMSKMGIRDADEGAKTHVWLASAPEAGNVSGKFFLDPGLEYPNGNNVTRAELVAAQDWFLPLSSDPLAKQLRLPDKFFDWRTPENAKALWEQSQEMVDEFKVA